MTGPLSRIEGRVLDAAGRAVAGARVLAYARARGPDGTAVGLIADENGYFAGAVPHGPSGVIAFQPSAAAWVVDPHGVDYSHEVQVTVPPEGSVRGIEVRLPYRLSELCTVAGRLVVGGKSGDWGAIVSLDGVPCVPGARPRRRCSEAGEFRFADVLPGVREVRYSATQWFVEGRVSIELERGEDRALVVEPVARGPDEGLRILIRCENDVGEGLPGVLMEIRALHGFVQATSSGARGEVVVAGLPVELREWVNVVVCDTRYIPQGVSKQAPFDEWPEEVVLRLKERRRWESRP